MEATDFFQRYQVIRNEDELCRALAAFADITRLLQRSIPKPERMECFMAEFGHPERSLRVIHLAGTSGKGSTTTFIAALLRSQGFHVGMTVSPHVRSLHERLQINGIPISTQDLAQLVEEAFAIFARRLVNNGELLHYFELMTALALLWFARQKVDYAVIETGLGGRFDATNVIRQSTKFCVFTPVDLDHQRLLGSTRTKIATEKSGILAPGVQAWSAPQCEEVKAVLDREAVTSAISFGYSQVLEEKEVKIDRHGTRFLYRNQDGSSSKIQLKVLGLHQAQNATVAIDVVRAISHRDGWSYDHVKASESLAQVTLPARYEIRYRAEQPFVLDVAHNPQKIRSLLEATKTLFPDRRIEMILGLNSLDQAEGIAAVIKEYAAEVILIDAEVGDRYQRYRLADVAALQEIFTKADVPLKGTIVDLAAALSDPAFTTTEKIPLITGSFYLVSTALPILDKLC